MLAPTLPSGTVTFLFTDIVGSTKLAIEHPDSWEALRSRHDSILRDAIESNHGYVFHVIGDAFCASFASAIDGMRAAIESQRKLQNENWDETPIKARMGLHTGMAEIQESGDYQGYLSLSRVQRLMSAGHGGQILISQATQELIRDDLPKDVNLRYLGEKRLKDLIRPEQIYQLDIAGLLVDFPALETLDKYRHNLPTQLTSFIGREKEMTEVKRALAEHRLVTLTGTGGAGKTRLSLQIAADLLDQFPNGVWFVELAPITDPDLIPQTILSAADMQTQQSRSALDSLKDFLREKTSLLVLDNCEHLVEACAKLADTLLHTVPNLRILASSREALRVQGEQAWHVPSLSIPDVKHLPAIEQLSQYEAVGLFIDRALLVQPHFAVTNDNAPAVAQICSRLDGIPLAIELAAARVKVLKVDQIAERLNDRFRLLTGGSRTALPRQQTLRALIDWSYDLLSENEKLLLRRLSVFMGGWTLEAAEQVCNDDSIHAEGFLDLLSQLVDKSLVIVDEGPSQLRYRMLETVRQYGREKLRESGEGEKIRTQHLAYFLKFAEEAEPHLFRTEQLEWLDLLELDHENLRTALEWAVESKHDDPLEAGFRLTNALWFFWYLRAYLLDGREWFKRVLEKSAQAPRTMVLARALGYAGWFENGFIRWGENIQSAEEVQKRASRLFEESEALCRELGDKTGLALVLLARERNEGNKLDNSTRKRLLTEALSLYQEVGNKWGVSFALRGFGEFAELLEYDIPTARQYYEESLKLSREAGERRRISLALTTLGYLALNQGDLPAARAYFEESLSLVREIGDKVNTSNCLADIGLVFFGQGEHKQATKALEESLAVIQEVGDQSGVIFTLLYLGRVARFQKDFEKAKKMQTENLAYSRETGDKAFITFSLWSLGELERLQGNYTAAHSFLTEGLTTAKEIDNRELVAYLLEESAALSAAQEQPKRAAILFGAAEALREVIHIVLFPVEKIEVDKNIAAARAQLSEEEFNQFWAEGKSMTMEQAITYALEEKK